MPVAAPAPQVKYGLRWPVGTAPLDIEFHMMRNGGYVQSGGMKCGEGLLQHYKNAQSICWPTDHHHRWSDLILKEYLENRIIAVMGSRDSGKTRGVAKATLLDYYLWPDETLILMTSTNLRGLELRLWGQVKQLHKMAISQHPHLPGNVADSKHGIFTDDISDGEEIRDMRAGIICIPMLGSKGEFMGESLRDFCGIKQKRRRLLGDEVQFIPRDYLKALDSLDKGDFRGAFLGNPIAENGKALDQVSEPKEGWGAQDQITKTTTWKNKYNGVTINLVGTDSPNFDEATPNRFPYLVDQGDVDRVSARPGGRDSLEWWSQIMGVRKAGAISNRVLTVSEIRSYGGFDDIIWSGELPSVKIYAIDAGFGGGDPCIRTWLEFGKALDGVQTVSFHEQREIPILLSTGVTAEKQIAEFTKNECLALGIPWRNIFFDAGMYATLAVEMDREMSAEINAVNFGGVATDRPVSNDLMVFDDKTQKRRLKTWYEHVSKYVTELWMVVRLAAQCRQLRNFPRTAAEEFGQRMWSYVSQNRYELETKDDYKLRNGGESPNHADSLAIAIEGARRRGFQIAKLSNPKADPKRGKDFLEKFATDYERMMKGKELQSVA